MQLFDLEAIRAIVHFQWMNMKQSLILYLFLPFFLYFCAFISSITFLHQDPSLSLYNFWVVLLVVMPLQVYFLGIEVYQFWDQKWDYFHQFWNILDLATLFTCGIISVLMLTSEASLPDVNMLGAVAVIMLYFKFFYFLRIFDISASYIRMIVQMTYEIRVFIFLYFFAIIGFGNGFYLLSLCNEPSHQFAPEFIDGITMVYRMTLGDFDTVEGFGSVNLLMVWVIFILCTLFIMIILLNLLIAIMGDTFGQVKETEQQSRIREYLQLILDN